MAIRTAASMQLREDECASLVIRMNSPHSARLRRLLAFSAFAPILLAFGALAPIDQLTLALRTALLQRVLAQYRCDRMRAMPHNVATAYTRAICTTEVRNSDGGLMKVLAWASHGSRARCEHACRKRRRSHCAADTGRRCWIVVRRHEPHRSNSGPAPRDRRIAAQVSSATTATGAGGVRQRRRSSIARKSIIDMVTSTLGLL